MRLANYSICVPVHVQCFGIYNMYTTRSMRLAFFGRKNGDIGDEYLDIVVFVEICVTDRIQLPPVRVLCILPASHLEDILQHALQ